MKTLDRDLEEIRRHVEEIRKEQPKTPFLKRKYLGIPMYLIVLLIASIAVIAGIMYTTQLTVTNQKPYVEITAPETITVYQGEWATFNVNFNNPTYANYSVFINYTISGIPDDCTLVLQYYNGTAWENINVPNGTLDSDWFHHGSKTYNLRMTLTGAPHENGVDLTVSVSADIVEVGIPSS